MRLMNFTRAAGCLALLPATAAAQWVVQPSGSTASLRGISVPGPRVAWASGSRGTVLRTVDGGATWEPRPVPGADSLDFRDVEALDAQRAWVLSIGPGAASRVYATADGGTSWTMQWKNADTSAFYDCITMLGATHGFVMSDPVRGRFRLIETRDGRRWTSLDDARSPEAREGEGGFAASGTCLVSREKRGGTGREHLWLATGGGKVARVLRSTNGGRSWAEGETPLPAGASSRGVFGIAMLDVLRGVAVGGDYAKPADSASVVALTRDGGATWRAPRGRQPGGYRSGVAYVPGTRGRVVVAVGTSGSDLSTDGGESWTAGDTLSLNAVAFAPVTATGWAVGPRGVIAKWRGVSPAITRRKD